MKRLLLAFLLLLAAAGGATAQNYQVVTTCGLQNNTGAVGTTTLGTVDIFGRICDNGGGAGGMYPSGSTPITASATGTTAATAATLAASATLSTYICGFSIRANATAAVTGNSTVAGTITGTLNFTQWTAPIASGIGITEETFFPCIKSSAINTAIVVTSAAPGTAGIVSVSAWGFQAP